MKASAGTSFSYQPPLFSPCTWPLYLVSKALLGGPCSSSAPLLFPSLGSSPLPSEAMSIRATDHSYTTSARITCHLSLLSAQIVSCSKQPWVSRLGNTIHTPARYPLSGFGCSALFKGGEAGCSACGIIVPWPEIEPGPLEVKALTPNCWTAREFLLMSD